MRIQTIKSRLIFQDLRKHGHSVYAGPFRVTVLSGHSLQIGFAMPKTLGIAVRRNKLRRQMTEAVNEIHQQQALPEAAYLFRAKMPATKISYSEIVSCLNGLLEKASSAISKNDA